MSTRKRIHQIAKEVGLSSKTALEKLQQAGFDLTSVSSSVDETLALQALAGGKQPGAAAQGPKRPTAENGEKKKQKPQGSQQTNQKSGANSRRVIIDTQASRRSSPEKQAKASEKGKGAKSDQKDSRAHNSHSQGRNQKTQRAPEKIRINSGSAVRDVAEQLNVSAPEIIKKLMGLGEMATLTQSLTDAAIELLAAEFDKQIEIVHVADEIDQREVYEDDVNDLQERPPVVTVMGHVDHGKTSLLDAIRKTEVAEGESGGITQHIGAYQVHHGDHLATFLDTPGHEAFTAMRARGARVTDIAVIVVAADDGVKPQTEEAIDHARAAGVPIVVAVNKIDKPGADPVRVRTELAQHNLQTAEWGGDTEFVDVSAKARQGLDELLDTIQVVAELSDLKANPTARASGAVVESKLDPGKGAVVTALIQRGTLRVGDALVAGTTWGRVRAMHDYLGRSIESAKPGDPVEILGFDGVPEAGEILVVVESDRVARQLAAERATRLKHERHAMQNRRRMSLENIFDSVKSGEIKELPLILKADVSGSVEAFEDEIARLPQAEVNVRVIHSGVGAITESDVMLAAASDAIILGFNVRPVGDATAVAYREGVEVRFYSIIYKALEDIRSAMEGMLEPDLVEEVLGKLTVRQAFRASRVGAIAGSYVTEGKVRRGQKARLVRDGKIVYTGQIASLRRFSDDVTEVSSGFECGAVLKDYQDVKPGDEIEVYEVRQVERSLSS